MRAIWEKIQSEPVVVTSFVAAVCYLLTEFGVDITDGQQAAILATVGALLAFIARASVTPIDYRPKHRAD